MKRKYEGNFKRVLCVCSAGILRSATIAWVLSNEPYRCNTRAVGLGNYALIRVTPQLLQWADEIVCADKEQFDAITRMTNKPVHCLHIPDQYDFRSPSLCQRSRQHSNGYQFAVQLARTLPAAT